MHLIFENEQGMIMMSGGGSSAWGILKDPAGLGIPEREYSAVRFAGQNGQTTKSTYILPRTITMSVALRSANARYEYERAVKFFHKPGTLKLYIGAKRRKISYYVKTFEPAAQYSGLKTFVLQLICDNPFFEGFNAASEGLFSTRDVVDGDNALPMVMTERLDRVEILNLGDVETEPIFYIQNESGGIGGESAGGFTITNHTNNQTLVLNYSSTKDEIVTINIAERLITSNLNGSLLNYLSSYSYLSNFWLDVGSNDIEFTCATPGEQVNGSIEFKNMYLEAVY